MKALRAPILTTIKRRSFSAVPAEARTTALQIKNSPSYGLVAKAARTDLSRSIWVYNAGPRYETPEYAGMTHALRASMGCGNLLFTKSIGHMGYLACSATRENIIYTFDTVLPMNQYCNILGDRQLANFLGHYVIPQEVEELMYLLRLDMTYYQHDGGRQVVEALHKAAYRNGPLGNSLYLDQRGYDTLSVDKMRQYLSDTLTPTNRCGVLTGVDQREVEVGEAYKRPPLPPSKYIGGERRVDSHIQDVVHAAVVTEGVSLDSKDLVTLKVLQRVMGMNDPRISRRSDASILAKAAQGASQHQTTVQSIQSAYTDTGLFGFQCAAHYTDIGKVLEKLVATFAEATKGSLISDAEVKKAKALLKVDMLTDLEDEGVMLEDTALRLSRGAPVVMPYSPESNMNQILEKVKQGSPQSFEVGIETQTTDNLLAANATQDMDEDELKNRLAVKLMLDRLLTRNMVLDEPRIAGGDEEIAVVAGDYKQLQPGSGAQNEYQWAAARAVAEIDAVTTEKVLAIAKKVLNGKPSMGIVGKLEYAPHVDDLF